MRGALEGAPGSPQLVLGEAAGLGVERLNIPDIDVPLLAVACRNCGHVMLFNEQMVLGGG